ncbi:biotin/lipoyl-binding protein [Flagellimonas onchidii]|uniref:biotin/lipoyl-binding protein n=1 Tax=Flagellimonas onchidii TaxID=2562684 RepID=UPI0010A6B373|nr:biotin/lipoyl-binding protein [Allomuricauda onchidii]
MMSVKFERGNDGFINEASQKVKEVMGKPPNWIIKWGTTIIFIIILVVVTGGSLIKLEDSIKVKVLLYNNIPLTNRGVKKGKKIEKLYVKPGESVKKGDILIELENNANLSDISRLKKQLLYLKNNGIELDTININYPFNLKLGRLNDSFIDFHLEYRNSMDSSLKINLDQNKLSLSKKLQKLNDEIIQWEKDFIITSPIDGTFEMIFNINESENRLENNFLIFPKNEKVIVGHSFVHSKIASEMRYGQSVEINLNNYPFHEWGSLRGTINEISAVTENDNTFYDVTFSIEDVKTSFGKRIEVKNGMQGYIIVSSKKVNILKRIFFELSKKDV